MVINGYSDILKFEDMTNDFFVERHLSSTQMGLVRYPKWTSYIMPESKVLK